MLLLADIGVAQNAHSLRVSGHDAVLDAIVDHLDEVPGAVSPAMQVTELGGAADILAPGRARDVSRTRGERREDGIKMPHGRLRLATRHAVPALQAPPATTRASHHY